MEFTKSLGYLQPTLASLSQFLVTKINFSKFLNYKRHILRLVNMPTKEKFIFVSVCDPKIPNIY
jgi:hypothetical protein